MECYNILTMGDSQTGKTSLSTVVSQNQFPTQHIPLKISVVRKDIMLHGKKCQMSLWEDASSDKHEDGDGIRHLSDSGTNTFIILFSVDSRKSFDNVKSYWIPEIRYYHPKSPIVIVANKIDLRDSGDCETVSHHEGFVMAKTMYTSYREISCKQLNGTEECYHHAIELAMLNADEIKKKLQMSSVVMPPLKPPPRPEPKMVVMESTYSKDLLRCALSENHHDVRFVLEGGAKSVLPSHRVFLYASSAFFRKVFTPSCDADTKTADCFSAEDLNSGKVPGIQGIHDGDEDQEVVITLSADIKHKAFLTFLEYLFSGSEPVALKDTDVSDLRHIAVTFEMPELVSHCDWVLSEQDSEIESKPFSLPKKERPAIAEFFKNDLFYDVVFNIQGVRVPAHKVVVCGRNSWVAEQMEKMTVLFPGINMPQCKAPFGGREPWESAVMDPRLEDPRARLEFPVKDCGVKHFTAFLEYLYTDSVCLDDYDMDNAGSLGTFAWNRRCFRLLTLCEVQIRKLVDLQIEKLEEGKCLDVVQLIEYLQEEMYCVPDQMLQWSYHYAGHNYDDDFNLRRGIREIKINRWPPVHYLDEMKDFEKNVLPVFKEAGFTIDFPISQRKKKPVTVVYKAKAI